MAQDEKNAVKTGADGKKKSRSPKSKMKIQTVKTKKRILEGVNYSPFAKTSVAGERIRETRQLLHMTIKELSEASGVPEKNILRYETGLTLKVPLESIDKLARALYVSPRYLVGWTFLRYDGGFNKAYNSYIKKYYEILKLGRNEKEKFRKAVIGFFYDYDKIPGNIEKRLRPKLIRKKYDPQSIGKRITNMRKLQMQKRKHIDNLPDDEYPKMEWSKAAKGTGLNRSSLWRYENSDTYKKTNGKDLCLYAANVKAIADELDCEPGYLVGWESKASYSKHYKRFYKSAEKKFMKMNNREYLLDIWRDLAVFIENYEPSLEPEALDASPDPQLSSGAQVEEQSSPEA